MRALLLPLAVVLAGCDGVGSGTGLPLDRPSSWRLVSAEGVPSGTLRFGEDGFSASAGCNAHFGAAAVSGPSRGVIRFDVQGSTRAHCGPELAAVEGRLTRALDAVRSYRVEGDVLTLAGGRGRLVFERTDG